MKNEMKLVTQRWVTEVLNVVVPPQLLMGTEFQDLMRCYVFEGDACVLRHGITVSSDGFNALIEDIGLGELEDEDPELLKFLSAVADIQPWPDEYFFTC